MKIVSYNINGIRASSKAGLIDWIKEYDADIYCFQEVRASKVVAREILFQENKQIDLFSTQEIGTLDYNVIFNCGEVAGYAGTMILSKVKPDKVLYDMGEFWQDNEGRTTTIIIDDLAIISTYIPNGVSRLEFKLKYIEALRKYVDFLKNYYSVVLVGDYNIAHNEIDLTNPIECRNRSVFLPVERKAFQGFLNLGMIDSFRFLHPELVKYSWRSYRSQEFLTGYNSWKYRLDYILISDDLKENLREADILDVNYSDHLPVFVNII